MPGKLLPLKIPSGVVSNGTRYQAQGRWVDAHLVRFQRPDTVRPVGGWEQVEGAGAPLLLTLVGGTYFVTNDPASENAVLAADTDGVYKLTDVLTTSGALPINAFGSAADFAYNAVRAILAWFDNSGVAHFLLGANDAAYHYVTGLTNKVTPIGLVGGAVDASLYGGGGYGSGKYGAGAYGAGAAATTTLVPAASWQFAQFGEDVVGVLSSDGVLWWYDTSAGGAMTQPAGSPTGNRGVVVTPERFVVLLGSNGDPRKIAWADRESLTTWTPDVTNEAGDIPSPGRAPLVCGRPGDGETLIWSEDELITMQFVGGTDVYGVRVRGSRCGVIAPHAVAMLGGRAVWMGNEGFWAYDGSVRPVTCDVQGAVFGDFNYDQRGKCFALSNADYHEIWFAYPSSRALEPDRVAIYNYEEEHWSLARITRTAGEDRGAFGYPLLCDPYGVFYHERGTAREGADAPWVESGPVEIGVGDRLMDIDAVVPDEATTAGQQLGSLRAYLYGAVYPTEAEEVVGPLMLANPTDVWMTARQVRLRLEEATAGDWRAGTFRLSVRPGSGR